ncbi:hypothetical protein, partial [Desulfovibrio sp.]|uniref:hypothetical protein n=1 Tax=Desulfovibrio sp. TaxID=885 RepID=UPI0023C4F067
MRRAIETLRDPRPLRGAHPALAGLCVLWLCLLSGLALADDGPAPAAAPEAAAEALRADRG